jgi:hypothetical protein
MTRTHSGTCHRQILSACAGWQGALTTRIDGGMLGGSATLPGGAGRRKLTIGSRGHLALVLLAALAAPSCRTHVEPPRYASIGYEPGATEAWNQVLHAYVDESGRVDLEGLKGRPDALERYVTWIAHNGPELAPDRFATRDEQLAFYINAHNALALYTVLLTGDAPRHGFFRARRFLVDGRYTTLDDLVEELIAPLGDERAFLALSQLTRSSPRLRREPYQASMLADQLERTAVEFFNDESHARYDAEDDEVELSWVLKEHKRAFLRAAPSLVAYANRYRANPLPEDADVDFRGHDRKLNARAE